jgi:hypothetical protein
MNMHDRKVVEKHLSELKKINYTPFRWWRNYQAAPPLPKNKLMIERIKNGDFETSPYFWMAQSALWEKHDNDNNDSLTPHEQRKRGAMLLNKYERLMNDFDKDEDERIETFIKEVSSAFKLDKEQLQNEFNEYPGTILEFYNKKREEWQKNAVTQVN